MPFLYSTLLNVYAKKVTENIRKIRGIVVKKKSKYHYIRGSFKQFWWNQKRRNDYDGHYYKNGEKFRDKDNCGKNKVMRINKNEGFVNMCFEEKH